MKLPRFRVRTLMMAVAVVAVASTIQFPYEATVPIILTFRVLDRESRRPLPDVDVVLQDANLRTTYRGRTDFEGFVSFRFPILQTSERTIVGIFRNKRFNYVHWSVRAKNGNYDSYSNNLLFLTGDLRFHESAIPPCIDLYADKL